MGLSGAIGDAWEILANVVESVAILVRALWRRRSRMGTSGQRGSVLVVCCFRTSGAGTGGVAASGRAVLGTGGVAAVSPVVTTVALEK
jgi:hypothetical protein